MEFLRRKAIFFLVPIIFCYEVSVCCYKEGTVRPTNLCKNKKTCYHETLMNVVGSYSSEKAKRSAKTKALATQYNFSSFMESLRTKRFTRIHELPENYSISILKEISKNYSIKHFGLTVDPKNTNRMPIKHVQNNVDREYISFMSLFSKSIRYTIGEVMINETSGVVNFYYEHLNGKDKSSLQKNNLKSVLSYLDLNLSHFLYILTQRTHENRNVYLSKKIFELNSTLIKTESYVNINEEVINVLGKIEIFHKLFTYDKKIAYENEISRFQNITLSIKGSLYESKLLEEIRCNIFLDISKNLKIIEKSLFHYLYMIEDRAVFLDEYFENTPKLKKISKKIENVHNHTSYYFFAYRNTTEKMKRICVELKNVLEEHNSLISLMFLKKFFNNTLFGIENISQHWVTWPLFGCDKILDNDFLSEINIKQTEIFNIIENIIYNFYVYFTYPKPQRFLDAMNVRQTKNSQNFSIGLFDDDPFHNTSFKKAKKEIMRVTNIVINDGFISMN